MQSNLSKIHKILLVLCSLLMAGHGFTFLNEFLSETFIHRRCPEHTVILDLWWQRRDDIFRLCPGPTLNNNTKISFISAVCMPRDIGYHHLRHVSWLLSKELPSENFTIGNFCRKFYHWPSDGHRGGWQNELFTYMNVLEPQCDNHNLTLTTCREVFMSFSCLTTTPAVGWHSCFLPFFRLFALDGSMVWEI